MPVKENVSEEMAEAFKAFLRECYEDFIAYKSRATLRCLIISLYETAKVVCTLNLDDNKGPANYKYVRHSLPIKEDVLALERLRDDLVHNYHKVEDVIISVHKRVLQFDKPNTTYIAEVCGLPKRLFGEIMSFCDAYIRHLDGNTPVQSSSTELAKLADSI